jgi:hypothetical protein
VPHIEAALGGMPSIKAGMPSIRCSPRIRATSKRVPRANRCRERMGATGGLSASVLRIPNRSTRLEVSLYRVRGGVLSAMM